MHLQKRTSNEVPVTNALDGRDVVTRRVVSEDGLE